MLFLSSYFPLALIFAVQFILKRHFWTAVIVMIVALLGFVVTLFWLRAVKCIDPIDVKISSVVRRDSEIMSYIVTYLLPFVALPSGELADSISLGIFLIVLCLLYVNSGMIHVNPTLSLLGWHLYEVVTIEDNSLTIISRRRLRRGVTLEIVRIEDEIYVEIQK